MKKMKHIIAATVLLTTVSAAVFSQDADTVRPWTTGGVFSLNVAQSSFTNWAAGGQNSVALNGLVNLTASYKKGKSAWDNVLTIGYGKMNQKGSDLGWVKTDDRIDLQSKYGRKATEKWYYSALFSFKTQIAPGYNYPNTTDKISDFLAPGYVLFSLGMDYKPSPAFSAFFSPVTSKNTIVRDAYLSSIGAFAVEPGKKFRAEFGAYANLMFKKDEIIKNVSLMSKLDLFSNYLHNPQNVKVSWENLLVLKVNKFISATVNTLLVYDDDILIMTPEDEVGRPRTQFKEVIGVGFTYKFGK
jgi:hypothetical protein